MQQQRGDHTPSGSGGRRRHSGRRGGGRGGGNRRDNRGGGARDGGTQHTPHSGGGGRRRGHHGGGGRRAFFTAHWDDAQVQHNIEAGSVVTGKLRINKKRRSEAYVSVDGLPMDVFIDGDAARNRALEGDEVAVELVDPTQWGTRHGHDKGDGDESKGADAGAAAAGAGAGSGAGAGAGAGASTGAEADREDVVSSLWQPLALADDSADTGARERLAAEAAEAQAKTDKLLARLALPTAARESLRQKGTVVPKGTVVAILKERHARDAVGVLRPIADVGKGEALPAAHKFVRLQPLDTRVPWIMIPVDDAFPADVRTCPSDHAYELFACHIDEWQQQGRFPRGHITKRFGSVGDVEAETAALLHEHHVRSDEFSDDVIRSLDEFNTGGATTDSRSNWVIPEDEIARRKDCRSARIFSIDPPSARDLDDALHVTKLDDGNFEIGVHIADVSYFVKPGSAVDKEASLRCTSTYLVQQVVPMLPRMLCENLCSLNPNVDRLAFSCVFKITPQGDLLPDTAPWFGRTVIRSCAKMDYGTAQHVIEGLLTPEGVAEGAVDPELWPEERRPDAASGHTMAEVARDIQYMHSIAKARRTKRYSSGAVSLNNPQLYVERNEEGYPVDVRQYTIRDSNRLIEEFMLLANYLTAQHLIVHAGERAVLRRHPPPSADKLTMLVEAAEAVGADIDFSSSYSLHKSLQRLKSSQEPRVLEALATMGMNVAQYFAVCSRPPNSWRHYALNIPYYTHFTSPIRRYADVLVHRMLQATLDGPEEVEACPPAADLERQCLKCNDRKSAADAASLDSDRVFMCLYLKDHPSVVDARVISIGNNSFTAYEPRWGLQKMIYADRSGAVAELDEETRTLTLRPMPTAASVRADGAAEGGDAVVADERRLDLRVMSQVRVRLVANMTKLPIDYDMELVDTEGWRQPAAAGAAAGAGAEAGGK